MEDATSLFTETDPILERSIKFKRGVEEFFFALQGDLTPYGSICQSEAHHFIFQALSNQQINQRYHNWDDEPTAASDDWDGEWTGSLEQTTVFGPSSSASAAVLTPSLSETLVETISVGATSACSTVSLAPTQPFVSSPPEAFAPATAPAPAFSPPSSSTVVSTFASTAAPTFSSATASTASITQPQSMDLAAFLQKAAPQSTLSGLVSSTSLGSSNSANNGGSGGSRGGGGASLVSPVPGLSVAGQHNILSGLSTNVGESLKAGTLVGSVGVTATAQLPSSSAPTPYSASTVQLPPTIFSSSG
ncbi:hypothetical protein E2C01_056108 [Portunus trituberculatus]|uniref:Uncharacterized protein n=1 Tax=Portunus trituberculatus TaxID=210409 RepID=A0A5B7GYR2_PORTR|nr:hypothetical protein [Portunus trituberculatus]